jgi:uncharacterized repeat protein (TIGR02543 family)
MRRTTILLVLVTSLFLSGVALAQTGGDYDLTWNTFDGSGATFSTGEDFVLGGTIGQPEAGVMSGGDFVLGGGFWMGGQVSEEAKYLLTVTFVGDGYGQVTSEPVGIVCIDGGNDCIENYDEGTPITLTALVTAGSNFEGWGGACNGTGSTCQVTMDADKTVTVDFQTIKNTLTVTLAGSGSGKVSSEPAGIDCGNGSTDCAADFELNSTITLTATADSGSTFAGWAGACSGTNATCQVTMDADKSITATFTEEGNQNRVYLPLVQKNP